MTETKTLLDPQVVEVLSRMDSFFIQQRVRMGEALTCGCWEQVNVYDVFDHETNKRIMIIEEESDDWSRFCCSPDHSVMVKFYLVGDDAPELQPGAKVDWSYKPSGDAFMTFEREGCDCCCTGPCPKPWIGCFACGEGCRQTGALYAGSLEGKPGEKMGQRERTKLLGETVQPFGGGGFRPVMQIMDRDNDYDVEGKTSMFSAVRGPCLFGGCAALCFDFDFSIAKADESMKEDCKTIHKQNFGDFASITKIKPKSLAQGAREFFTDSDLFDVKFNAKEVTPQQKANILAQMVHLDYMFFENDSDMVERTDDGGTFIRFFNCYCYGCACPCGIKLKGGD